MVLWEVTHCNYFLARQLFGVSLPCNLMVTTGQRNFPPSSNKCENCLLVFISAHHSAEYR